MNQGDVVLRLALIYRLPGYERLVAIRRVALDRLRAEYGGSTAFLEVEAETASLASACERLRELEELGPAAPPEELDAEEVTRLLRARLIGEPVDRVADLLARYGSTGRLSAASVELALLGANPASVLGAQEARDLEDRLRLEAAQAEVRTLPALSP